MVTPMTTAYFEDEAVTSSLLGRVPAGRWGMPTDLEPAVLFLASPANTFTTGTSVTVDGGFCGN
jgi:2-deoxy-D-gluconate 3-dehydrogenase